MQSEGVIAGYAIGDAVGATFYLEPAATLDPDNFVTLPANQGRGLISLTHFVTTCELVAARLKVSTSWLGSGRFSFSLQRIALGSRRQSSKRDALFSRW
jgi:hypothetical protein